MICSDIIQFKIRYLFPRTFRMVFGTCCKNIDEYAARFLQLVLSRFKFNPPLGESSGKHASVTSDVLLLMQLRTNIFVIYKYRYALQILKIGSLLRQTSTICRLRPARKIFSFVVDWFINHLRMPCGPEVLIQVLEVPCLRFFSIQTLCKLFS